MEAGAEIEVVLGDLHVGHPQSQWKAAIDCLVILNRKYKIFAIYFAGDTLELAYAHEFGGTQELQKEYEQFFQALQEQQLSSRSVLLLGNHDSSLKIQPSTHGFTVAEYAWLYCQTFRILIHHGHCTGFERQANTYGKSAKALRRLRAQIELDKGKWLPALEDKDWMITGHFDIPVRDLPKRVVGLGSWIGNLNRNDRGYYALIHPQTHDAPITLRKYKN